MKSHKIFKIGLMRQPCSSSNLDSLTVNMLVRSQEEKQGPIPEAHLQVWDWIGMLIPTDASWACMMQVVGSGRELWVWRCGGDITTRQSAQFIVAPSRLVCGLSISLITCSLPTSQSAPACTVVALVLFCSLPSESSVIEWSVCFINAVCNYCICITNKATWAVSKQIPYQHDVLEHFQVM